MIIFKSCVRCHGDVYVRDDQHGQFLECLQCGATTDVPVQSEVESLPEIA